MLSVVLQPSMEFGGDQWANPGGTSQFLKVEKEVLSETLSFSIGIICYQSRLAQPNQTQHMNTPKELIEYCSKFKECSGNEMPSPSGSQFYKKVKGIQGFHT